MEGYTDAHGLRWESDDYYHVAMRFNIIVAGINLEDATVYSTYTTDYNWIFTTATSLYDMEHPVSGSRMFGIYPDSNGSWVFYTRGYDKMTTTTTIFGDPFAGGDDLWKSLQKNISKQYGAKINDPVTNSWYFYKN